MEYIVIDGLGPELSMICQACMRQHHQSHSTVGIGIIPFCDPGNSKPRQQDLKM